MKSMVITTLFFVILLAQVAVAQSEEEMALYRARTKGAKAKECLRIINQDGMPVEGADIFGGLQTGGGRNDFTLFRGMTDTNGEYVIQGKCTNRIRCDITKVGYYDSEFLSTSYGFTHTVSNGMWQPYGRKTELVLKKIINPSVSGTRYINRNIPAYGQWMGYDLKEADWVPPLGNGKLPDVMIRFMSREVGALDFGYKMELSFAHFPFAGVIRKKKDITSRFPCVYAAKTNDMYKSGIVFEVDRTGSQKRIWDELNNDEYLIFRTRTTINERGELVSAHYGRIDGEWRFDQLHEMWIRGVYFNDVPNNTNLEDKYSFEDEMLRIRQREEDSSYKKKRKSIWPF